MSLKRSFDFVFALAGAVFIAVPFVVLYLVVKGSSLGPALYWSDRIGRNNGVFKMPKFRSMRIDTPAVATHLLQNPDQWLTPVGSFLRKTSLDELPQLWSILKGDMSFVGPRPALFNQDDLIALRTDAGVHELLPGLTGWAQINGRDGLPIPEKVKLDLEYLHRRSFGFDLWILWLTLLKVVRRDGVSH
jgi:O-antigen biosynthesis protein WbqP